MKKNALFIAAVTALGVAALPAMANEEHHRISGDEEHHHRITADIAPPAPQAEESAPAPREGYIWAPGYYSYSDHKHVWTKGHYVRARPGYRYEGPHWVQEENRWTLYPEQWVKNEDDKEKTVTKDSSPPRIAERR